MTNATTNLNEMTGAEIATLAGEARCWIEQVGDGDEWLDFIDHEHGHDAAKRDRIIVRKLARTYDGGIAQFIADIVPVN